VARSRKRLVDVIERELKARGFEYLGPESPSWRMPDGNEGSILEAIVECMKLEDAAHVERPLSDPGASQLGPFVAESETSQRAALNTQRRRILWFLYYCASGATRETIGVRLGIPDKSVGPRVLELIDGGWVEEGEDTCRDSDGLKATLVRLTREGRTKVLWGEAEGSRRR
jgi:hypothetical protein